MLHTEAMRFPRTITHNLQAVSSRTVSFCPCWESTQGAEKANWASLGVA